MSASRLRALSLVALLAAPALSACAGMALTRIEPPFVGSFYDRDAVDRAFRAQPMPVVVPRPLAGMDADTSGAVVVDALTRGYPRPSAGFTLADPAPGSVPAGYYLVIQTGGNVTPRTEACTAKALQTANPAMPTAPAMAPTGPQQLGLAICYGDTTVSATQGSLSIPTADGAGYAPLVRALLLEVTPPRNPNMDNDCLGFCNDARAPIGPWWMAG
ncbi:MAG: hypothetical protein CMO30_03290 [Tistrella sp.]|jgi:hypothetical protein|uniref:Lipoprotein n=1 Tax=Tistrella mobilis TaxID=171437 RepID=A0A3B9IQ58_9PROT|nr:hypothetical protein [Tistrella sp.]MAD39743.1 hypothetical protein [Tistrella sp.]MBA74297.1 hypothetical protein [Tistrella sp.]HAE49935.1 hypothetical protein [Tistrella mobilis]